MSQIAVRTHVICIWYRTSPHVTSPQPTPARVHLANCHHERQTFCKVSLRYDLLAVDDCHADLILFHDDSEWKKWHAEIRRQGSMSGLAMLRFTWARQYMQNSARTIQPENITRMPSKTRRSDVNVALWSIAFIRMGTQLIREDPGYLQKIIRTPYAKASQSSMHPD